MQHNEHFGNGSRFWDDEQTTARIPLGNPRQARTSRRARR